MTSKEALNEIKNHLFGILDIEAPELKIVSDRRFKIIEKDLEILEILRKNMGISRLHDFMESILLDIPICDKDFKTVKEWLENDIKRNNETK